VTQEQSFALFSIMAHAQAALQIQAVLEREEDIAKAHLAAGRKDRAIIALRQRKYQQSLLLKTDSQLENLEQLARIVYSVFVVRISSTYVVLHRSRP
jgi:hypothetical protein